MFVNISAKYGACITKLHDSRNILSLAAPLHVVNTFWTLYFRKGSHVGEVEDPGGEVEDPRREVEDPRREVGNLRREVEDPR